MVAFSLLILASSIAKAEGVVGVLYSEKNLKLAMSDSGIIKKIHVRSGAKVRKGQVLVTLDQSIQRLETERYRLLYRDKEELKTLENSHIIFQSKYDDGKALYDESRSISLDELEGLKLDLIQSTGRIAQLKEKKLREKVEYQLSEKRLAQRKLLAPIDGVITKVTQQIGEWAQMGEPFIGLVDTSSLYVKVNVNDGKARMLKIGKAVVINIANLPSHQGVIDYIAPVADPASGLVEVKVKVDNLDGVLRPGAKVMLPL